MGRKNFWILLIMLLAGIVLGGFIGQLADGISWLKWMNYGQSFGLDTPLVIDFGLLVITFGLTIKITMASIIGVAVALFIYNDLKAHPENVLGEVRSQEDKWKELQ